MIMEMNSENFKNLLVATKALKKVLGRNLTDCELDELINTNFESFCEKRSIDETKVFVINQMRDFINKYAETPNILPAYCFSPEAINFISELYKKIERNNKCDQIIKNDPESLEDDINNMEGFTADSKEDEFKIALKELLDKYKIFNNEHKNNKCSCAQKTIEDDIDILIDRLKEGEDLEVSEELQNQIIERLCETNNNFSIKIVNGKMSLKE